MKIHILLFLTFLAGNFAFSQSDTINQRNSNNEKTGWWITYLDKDLAKTSDTCQAKYYRYSYFDGKFDYYNMGRIGSKKNPGIAPVSNTTEGEIPPLNGEYKANYSNGRTQFILKANNGRFTEYLEYRKNGKLKTKFDYRESCGAKAFQYCVHKYRLNGELKNKSTLRTP